MASASQSKGAIATRKCREKERAEHAKYVRDVEEARQKGDFLDADIYSELKCLEHTVKEYETKRRDGQNPAMEEAMRLLEEGMTKNKHWSYLKY